MREEVLLLNMGNLPDTASMMLTKFVPKKSGVSLSWDAVLSAEVPDEDAAEVVEQYLPGALAVYHARESSKGDVKTSGGFELVRATFATVEGVKLGSALAEVRQVACKATAQNAVLIVRLRLDGLLTPAAMEVVMRLDEMVEVRLEEHTAQLSLLPKPPTESLEGKLVVHSVGDGVVSGIVAEHDGQTIKVATMETDELVAVVLEGQPDTVLTVCAADGADLRGALLEYVERCDGNGVAASWNDVVVGIGKVHVDHQTDPNAEGAWELTEQVWNTAFDLAQRQQAANG